MVKLPSISGSKVVKALENAGFYVANITGSHHQMKKPEYPLVVSVPVHASRNVPNGTLRSIIKTAGLTVDEFVALTKKKRSLK